MKRWMRLFASAVVAGLLAGCGDAAKDRPSASLAPPPLPAPTAAVPTVFDSMTVTIAPQAAIVWDVSNAALDDDGNFDASRLEDDAWQRVGAAAKQMKIVADALAAAPRYVVVAPGKPIHDEGTSGASNAAQVQGFIDADPAGFAELARQLSGSAEAMIQAVAAHDGARLGEAAANLDGICEQCHQKFWYPQQATAR